MCTNDNMRPTRANLVRSTSVLVACIAFTGWILTRETFDGRHLVGFLAMLVVTPLVAVRVTHLADKIWPPRDSDR